jgi:anthranilate/para-aminobenzoate synthase component II
MVQVFTAEKKNQYYILSTGAGSKPRSTVDETVEMTTTTSYFHILGVCLNVRAIYKLQVQWVANRFVFGKLWDQISATKPVILTLRLFTSVTRQIRETSH